MFEGMMLSILVDTCMKNKNKIDEHMRTVQEILLKTAVFYYIFFLKKYGGVYDGFRTIKFEIISQRKLQAPKLEYLSPKTLSKEHRFWSQKHPDFRLKNHPGKSGPLK